MGWIWSFRGRGEKGECEWSVMVERYVRQIVSRLSTNTHEYLRPTITLISYVFTQA
jgi:hypothetical protein